MTTEPAPQILGHQIERGTGRPERYKTLDGKVCPSVTTVTGRFKDSGALIAWAYGRGRDGLPRFDDSADVGTVVHKVIEAKIHGRNLDAEVVVPDEMKERVASAYRAWQEWLDDTRLTIVATEQPFVSEKHRYGGTLDAIARDRHGRLCLLDWKSSGGIYEDYLWQLAAYGALWNECNEEQLSGGFRIVRISKEHGDLDFRFFPELDDALRTFLLLREAYEVTRSVKKRAA